MNYNSKRTLNLNATKLDTSSLDNKQLHQLYKDFFRSAEEDSLLLVNDEFCYLDHKNRRKIIDKKSFDLHFSETISSTFDRILFSLKNPDAEDRMSSDAIFIFLNIFNHPIFNNCCIEKGLSKLTSDLHKYMRSDPNAIDTKILLSTYVSAYADVHRDISNIKNATEYFMHNHFLSASAISGSTYFSNYTIDELLDLSTRKIIDKADIIDMLGENNYQEEILIAKSKCQMAKFKGQKEELRAKTHFNKLTTLPKAFPILCDMHQNQLIDNNDLKSSKPTKKNILELPEKHLVYVLTSGIFSNTKISSTDLIKLYGNNLSGDKCIFLAKQGFIAPQDLITTLSMESVPRVSPELAIDPLALFNFYEPEVLFKMYNEGTLTPAFVNTFNSKLLSKIPEEEKTSFANELIRKTQEFDKNNSDKILFDYYKFGLLPNSSLGLFLNKDKITDLYINDKLEDKDLLNFYKAGLISQNGLYDFFGNEGIIENVANKTFSEADLLAIPAPQREKALSDAYLAGALPSDNLMHMFLEHDIFSIDKIDLLLKEKEPEEDLIMYVTEASNPDRIKDLFLNYNISYEDLTILKNRGLLSEENFNSFASAIDKNKFYKNLKNSNLVLHSVTPETSSDSTGRYYSNEPNSRLSKARTDFNLEKEALQILLDAPDFENEKDEIPTIISIDQNGNPTSLDGYSCIPISKYGLVIFEKFARSNSLFIMPYQQADYFLHGNMNLLDSSLDINSKNKKTLSQMSSVIVRQHTKHFLRNVLDATMKLNPAAKEDLKPNGKYSPEAIYYIDEMENFYTKVAESEKNKGE